MNTNLTFLDAAGTVTGSRYQLRVGELRKIFFDFTQTKAKHETQLT